MEKITKKVILHLQQAVNDKNIKKILSAYNLAKTESLDWDKVPDYIFEEWDKLVDEGNMIIEKYQDET